MRSCILLVVFSLHICPSLPAQQAPAAKTAQPLPRNTLYRLLFNEIAAFQNQASQLAAQGKPNAFILNYHRSQFQLSSTQADQLVQIALPCAQQIKALDDQARAIIGPVKKQYGLSPHVAVPPPPPALADLEAQRTAVVLAAADSIAAAFGPTQFAPFELLVQKHFGSKRTTSMASSTN